MTILLYFLNVACSAGQSTLSKHYASKGGNANIYNINKVGAGALVFLAMGLLRGLSFHLPTVLLGMGYGTCLYVSNFAGFTALAMGPMALTSIIASFSLVIPFLVGITLWGEALSLWGAVGVGLLLCSIVLINFKSSGDRISFKWLFFSFLTFFSNSISSIVQKQHQLLWPGSFRTEFMLSAMLWGSVLLAVTVLIRGTVRTEVRFCVPGTSAGLIEGIANYVVLYLAATQDASVLFPVVSAAKIIAVWAIGRIGFKEQLRPAQTLGLLSGIAAIIFLNL